MKVQVSIVLKSFEVPNGKEVRSSTYARGRQELASPPGEQKIALQAKDSQFLVATQLPKGILESERVQFSSREHGEVPKRDRSILADRSSFLSIRLPLKQSNYTVLRSPHIDKKSREQFEMKIHKQLIKISAERKELASKLVHLKNHEMSGVQMKVLFHYKTRLSSNI